MEKELLKISKELQKYIKKLKLEFESCPVKYKYGLKYHIIYSGLNYYITVRGSGGCYSGGILCEGKSNKRDVIIIELFDVDKDFLVENIINTLKLILN